MIFVQIPSFAIKNFKNSNFKINNVKFISNMSINFGNNVISIKLKTDSNKIFTKNNPELERKKSLIKENIETLIGMLNRILKNDKINEISYEKIYTLAYKICNEKANKELYENLKDMFSKHLIKIYHEIEYYFLEFEEISEFVYKMIETYKDFSYRVGIIQKTLLYYEKNFLQKQNVLEENLKLIADNVFYEIFINDKTSIKLIEFVILILNKARENEYIDKLLLRSLIEFFIEIKPREKAYKETLEPQIINTTVIFYQKYCFEKNFSKKYSCENEKNHSLTFISNYIKEVYKILIDEEIRYIDFNLIISRNYLLENILESLFLNVIENEEIFFQFLMSIINEPNKEIINTLRNCLDFPSIFSNYKKVDNKNNDKLPNNNFDYNINKFKNDLIDKSKKLTVNQESEKIKKIKDLLYSKVAFAIETVGKDFFEEEKIKFLEKKSNSNINYYLESVISIVDRLINLLENIEVLKAESNIFNNKKYTQLIQTKLSLIVNHKFQNNKKEEKDNNLSNFLFSMSTNLATHIDFTIKNFPHKFNYDYIINYFDKIMLVFKLLDDKDIFEISNRRYLTQRILSQIYNEDLELKLISKLKLENGTIFTFRSEIMINDIKNSLNTLENYRTSKYNHKLSKELEIFKNLDINYKILTQGSWLINQEENINFKELISLSENNQRYKFLKILEKFDDYYKVFFRGKILYHNLSHSTFELYSRINGRHYNFTVCSLQALILLSFYYKKNKKIYNEANLQNNSNLEQNNKQSSNLLSIITIYSFMYKISKVVFINSLIPLIKLGLIKLILIKEDYENSSLNDLNNKTENQVAQIEFRNENEIKNLIFYNLNLKESKIPLFELFSNFFDMQSQKENLENLIKGLSKQKKYYYENTYSDPSQRGSLIVNSLAEFSFLKLKDIALEINLNFCSKQQKLKINYLREKERKSNLNESINNKKDEEDTETLKIERKYQVESNIIRILKCKKIISHQELVNETLNALTSYFVPNITMIKLRIENLIERGFISRDKNDYNKYVYEM